MPRRLSRPPYAIVAAAILLVLLLASLAACGSSSTTTTSASPTTTPGGADSTTAAPAPADSTTASAESTTTSDTGESLAGGALTISAASSLKDAFTEIGKAFDEANGSKTTFNFDASGTLQKQIEAGAPVDVFAAAAPTQMNNLLAEGLVDQASVKDFASNDIVIAIPARSTLQIASFEDLTKPEVIKVAYGDPAAAPHGAYAEEVLSTLGILDQVKPKVIYTKNASQTLTYVSSGEVDAGIMFATDAAAGGESVKVVATADPGWHSQIVYPIGVVSDTKAKSLAQAFVDFVAGKDGQSILHKYGFVTTSEDSPVTAG
jgi:molybdate transport system substrate-binding protein